MDIKKITDELARRFNPKPPEPYIRRIIFWDDPEKEFFDVISEIKLFGVKVIILTGNNNFIAKKTLLYDDTRSNYLIYCPFSYRDIKDDWFLNIRLYSETFRADIYHAWAVEMNLSTKPNILSSLKPFKKFFKAQSRRNAFIKYKENIELINSLAEKDDEENLNLKDIHFHIASGVLSAIANCKKASFKDVLRNILSESFENNKIYDSIVNHGCKAIFNDLLYSMTGMDPQNGEINIEALAIHISATAASDSFDRVGSHLMDYIPSNKKQRSFCYDLISEWIQEGDKDKLFNILRLTERKLDILEKIKEMPIETIEKIKFFPAVEESIIITFFEEIANYDTLIKPEQISNIKENRKHTPWYDIFLCYFLIIKAYSDMIEFQRTHESYTEKNAKALWKKYESELYLMDSYYRIFQKSIKDSQKKLLGIYQTIDSLISTVKEKGESVYRDFLKELNTYWLSLSSPKLKEQGYITEILPQTKFYQYMLKDEVINKGRIFVIISDALRYEVGMYLSEELRNMPECKGELKINCWQSILPSITKFGMASLLPHTTFEARKMRDEIQLYVDGILTNDMVSRERILQKYCTNSSAVKYSDFINFKKDERKERFKDKKITYIYHNDIDEEGHLPDSDIFSACYDTVDKIKSLVRLISSEFSSPKIIITADHGFIYTDDQIIKSNRIPRPSEIIECGNRYAITEGNILENMTEIKFVDSKFRVFTPSDTNLIGSYSNCKYIHGGASLQEMAIPLIEFKRTGTEDSRAPVGLILISLYRKISGRIFSLEFYQKNAVSKSYNRPCTYRSYLTDENGVKITDIATIVADRETKIENERRYKVVFRLKSGNYDYTKKYDCIIEDENGTIVERYQFEIDVEEE